MSLFYYRLRFVFIGHITIGMCKKKTNFICLSWMECMSNSLNEINFFWVEERKSEIFVWIKMNISKIHLVTYFRWFRWNIMQMLLIVTFQWESIKKQYIRMEIDYFFFWPQNCVLLAHFICSDTEISIFIQNTYLVVQHSITFSLNAKLQLIHLHHKFQTYVNLL